VTVVRRPNTVRERPNWVAGCFAALWLVIVGVPIYTMISWSLQTREDFLDRGPIALPRSLYLIINRMRLYDSLTAIVLPTVAFGLPLVILVLAGSLRDVSDELYDAMTIDGAGPLRILWQLVIPLSRGSIAGLAGVGSR
jgi:ABC-type glycerol-3-phosphate transport system permease component